MQVDNLPFQVRSAVHLSLHVAGVTQRPEQTWEKVGLRYINELWGAWIKHGFLMGRGSLEKFLPAETAKGATPLGMGSGLVSIIPCKPWSLHLSLRRMPSAFRSGPQFAKMLHWKI